MGGVGMTPFTVILEYAGGTYVSQFRAYSVEDALTLWQRKHSAPENWDLDRRRAQALFAAIQRHIDHERELDDLLHQKSELIPPLSEVSNVWCLMVWVGEELALFNFVATLD